MTEPGAPAWLSPLVAMAKVGLATERDEKPSVDVPPGPIPRWREVVATHGLVPLLAPAASRLGIEQEEALWLAGASNAHALRSLTGASDTALVHRALSDAGVQALALKGSSLAVRTTGRLDGRVYSDIDVLVAADSLDAAGSALRTAGWAPVGPSSTPLEGRYPRWARITAHHLVYDHPERMTVELHWQPAHFGALMIPFEQLWRERIAVGLGGTTVWALGDVHELLQVSTHAAIHRFMRLGWVVDIARLVRGFRGGQWHEAVAAATAAGVLRPLAMGVAMAAAFEDHDAAVPLSPRDRRVVDRLVAGAWSAMSERGSAIGGPKRWGRLASRLALRADLRYKARALAEAAASLDLVESTDMPAGLAFVAAPFKRLLSPAGAAHG